MFPGVGFDVGKGKPKEDERFQPMTGLKQNEVTRHKGVTRHITKTWALSLRFLF